MTTTERELYNGDKIPILGCMYYLLIRINCALIHQ